MESAGESHLIYISSETEAMEVRPIGWPDWMNAMDSSQSTGICNGLSYLLDYSVDLDIEVIVRKDRQETENFRRVLVPLTKAKAETLG